MFYETLIAVLTNLNTINWYTVLISAVSLFVLFLPKCCLKGKIPKWVPLPLIVVVFWILVSYFADLESLGVAIIGNDIKAGFPAPKAPDFQYFGDVFAAAIVVAIVSYMGSIALAKGFEQKTKETYKQDLSKYNQWCRDNVDTMDDDIDIKNIGRNGRNPHNSGYDKLPDIAPGSAVHTPNKYTPNTATSVQTQQPESTPIKRIIPGKSNSNPSNDKAYKLKDEGFRASQETAMSAANGSSFSPTLSEKGGIGTSAIAEADRDIDQDGTTSIPLMGIDKYSMQC